MTSGSEPLHQHAAVRVASGTPQKRRFIPIGVKFAVAVVVTLVTVALVVGVALSGVARQGLVQSKLVGAEMIVDNIAQALAPAMDFGDDATISEYAQRLRATRDVSRVIIWNQQSNRPVYASPEGVRSPAPGHDAYRVSKSEIVLTRLLRTPLEQPVGKLEVAFSLGPENRSYRLLRRRILTSTGFLALVVAALVIVIARLAIVKRLKQLLRAMTQLRLGNETTVDTSTGDEIGELAAGFNEMALAIRDRERNLSIERDKSHELLDNMRQAILVVGRDGLVLDARSRQAEQIFGRDIAGRNIADLLCDSSRPAIERQAFDAWLDTAFALGLEGWVQVSALAPTEATVTGVDGATHILVIDTSPISFENQLIRIMFLCSDVTAQKAQQASAQQREVEHDRQMNVMRALTGRTGLQMVATLRNIEERLTASASVLSKKRFELDDINEVFQYVHSIKGDASAFDLESLVQASAAMEAELSNYRAESQHGAAPDPVTACHNLESALSAITNALDLVRQMVVTASPSGANILDQVTVRRTDLLALNDACSQASPEIKELASRTLAQPFGSLVWALAPACRRWTDRLSKQIALEIEGQDVLVPHQLARILSGVLTQLVRNSVSHGIESPAERLAAGKPETGRIQLQCRESVQRVEVHVIDDGCGLREDLLVAGQTIGGASIASDEAAFLPGVSTADGATVRTGIGGCGVGLGLIRAELATVDYSVSLHSTPGKGLDVRLFYCGTPVRDGAMLS